MMYKKPSYVAEFGIGDEVWLLSSTSLLSCCARYSRLRMLNNYNYIALSWTHRYSIEELVWGKHAAL